MLLSLWVLVAGFIIDSVYKSTRDYFLIRKARTMSAAGDYVMDEKRIIVMQITSIARVVAAAAISLVVYLLLLHNVIIVNTHTPWFIIYYIVPVLAYDNLIGLIGYIIGYIHVKFNAKTPFK